MSGPKARGRWGFCLLSVLGLACSGSGDEVVATSGTDGAPGDQAGPEDEPLPRTGAGGSVSTAGSGGMAEDGAASGGAASGGATAETGGSFTGGNASGGGTSELELEGAPPPAATHPATPEHWQLLPDTNRHAEYTYIERKGSIFSIPPLEPENFPPSFDFCNAAGGDAELNGAQQFARARLKADLKTWYYDVTLFSVPEEDGNTPYRLYVGGELAREFTAPNTGTGGAEDLKAFSHTWEKVPIETGEAVEVWTAANSNLVIEEDAGCRSYSPTFAWARGRFGGIELAPSEL